MLRSRIARAVCVLFVAWSGCSHVDKSSPDASDVEDTNTLPHVCTFDIDVFDTGCAFGQ